jgi:trans-L-3-hydroxyproline dehydratase
MRSDLTMRTIDAHAGGGCLRLIVDGFPAPRGRTMLEKRQWARRRADDVRRFVMLEPRGHGDISGAVFTEPTSPGSHAGVLFMDNEGFGEFSGHGIIAAATIALERGLLMPGGHGGTIVFDTTAGTIRVAATLAADEARAAERGGVRVERVSVLCPPSFVLQGGLTVKLGGRLIRADVAYGGAFHAIVDAEAVGIPIDAAHASSLRRAAGELKSAIEASRTVAHPTDAQLQGIYGTVFTGPPNQSSADLRAVSVFADAAVDRSPSGTGTAAIMAVLDAIGLIAGDRPFICEGLVGTQLACRIASRTTVGDYQAIVPEIEGAAWIIAEHTHFIDAADPLKDGFRV